MILLHGSIHVTIYEAEEISNSSSQAPGFLRKVLSQTKLTAVAMQCVLVLP